MRWAPFTLLVFLLGLGSCSLPEPVVPNGDIQPSEGILAQPQGLWVAEDTIYMTNANYHIEQGGVVYGEGFVSVLERAGLTEVQRWTLPLKNPVYIRADGTDLWVLCMGGLQRNEDGSFHATEAGGLVLIPDALGDGGPSPSMESFHLGQSGSAGSWAWLADGSRLVLGSSIAPELYVFDLESRDWIRGPENPIYQAEAEGNETLSVAAHPDGHIGVFSFARNAAHLMDGQTFEMVDGTEEANLGIGEELEGPLSAVFVLENDTPVAYVVLSLSNSLARWRPDDASATDPRFQSLGLTPNQVIANDSTLFVVESGDNVLRLIPIHGGAASKVVFPVGTNPYSAALSPDGTLIYVSGLLSNSLYEVHIQSTAILRNGPVDP